MKLSNPKTTLAVLLLLTTSMAHATPATAAFVGMWDWLFPEALQPMSSEVCPSFPSCPIPPPVAPTPTPAEQETK